MRARFPFVVVAAALAGIAGCAPSSSAPSSTAGAAPAATERYLGTAAGGMRQVAWNDIETDFARAVQPGSLTFVELSGTHCGGCKKNAKLFDELAKVRTDIAFRVVDFPDELCPENPT